jgi:type I restriction-modification system DNA methylase subunit
MILSGYKDDKAAVEALIREKVSSRVPFTEEEKDFFRKYEGAGGTGLREERGVLDEFYTPAYITQLMWELALHHGFQAGESVLEPSCGVGRFFEHAPDGSPLVGFEINDFAATITEVLYPHVKLYRQYFETAFLEHPRFTTRIRKGTTWLPEYPFGLLIGNPPYGVYRNKYSAYFKKPKVMQIEIFFMYYGLQLLKPGGVMMYLTAQNFLRSGDKYNAMKDEIGKTCELVDAYRLPAVFVRSKVPTDILIFKKNQ